MKKLLPIGSVVLLSRMEKRVMIYGRLQKEKDTDKEFDYVGCYYPDGLQDSSQILLFNQEDVDVLFFVGFQDVEEFLYRDELEKYLSEEQN